MTDVFTKDGVLVDVGHMLYTVVIFPDLDYKAKLVAYKIVSVGRSGVCAVVEERDPSSGIAFCKGANMYYSRSHAEIELHETKAKLNQ